MSIEQLSGSTYKIGLTKDWIEVTPTVASLKRWGGERSLDFEPAMLIANAKLSFGTDYLQWANNNVGFRWLDRGRDVEFQAVFFKRPAFSSVSVNVNMTGLTAYRQQPLTTEFTPGWAPEFKKFITVTETEVHDVATGDMLAYMRPEYVGGYVVYDDRPPMHNSKAKATLYGTFKAWGLPTPYLVDALGNRHKCAMLWVGNTLTISWAKAWMDAAALPVVLDPTFEVTTEPTVGYTTLEGQIVGVNATCTEIGTGVSMTAFIEVTTATHNTKCALYDGAATPVFVTNGGTDQVAVPVQARTATVFPFTVGPTLAAQGYTLCVWADAAPAGNAILWRDGAAYTRHLLTQTYNGWPADLTGEATAGNVRHGTYVTYTTGGGAAAPPKWWYYQQYGKGRNN